MPTVSKVTTGTQAKSVFDNAGSLNVAPAISLLAMVRPRREPQSGWNPKGTGKGTHPAESVEIGHNSDDKLNILAKTTNIDNMQRIGHVFARF
jgi:hypothetical protein